MVFTTTKKVGLLGENQQIETADNNNIHARNTSDIVVETMTDKALTAIDIITDFAEHDELSSKAGGRISKPTQTSKNLDPWYKDMDLI